MEEIEYLEEYEDLVLPALNSAAAAAATSATSSTTSNPAAISFPTKSSQAIDNYDDGSSSSLDQDIFHCLFDDQSDDNNDDNGTSLTQKRESRASLDSLDILEHDLSEQVAKEVALQKAQQEPAITINTSVKPETKIINSSTPKPKTFTQKNSGPTEQLTTAKNTTTKVPQTATANKQKSIATVRPTIQSQQKQQQNKKTNLIQKSSFTTQQQKPKTTSSGISSTSLCDKPTTSRTIQLPVLARKPLSAALTPSTSSAVSSSSVGTKVSSTPLNKPTVKKFIKRPATIVKPEKVITKDPSEDPLNLEDLSEAGSDNYTGSDISGETYNFFSSDFDDEYDFSEEEHLDDEEEISSNSQIIELSNDSSCSTSNLEDLRAPSPSPVMSHDRDLPSGSSGIYKKKKISKPLFANRNILRAVLSRPDKPRLSDLIKKYGLEKESSDEEGDNVVIDITNSRENLLDNVTSPKARLTNDTLKTHIKTTTPNTHAKPTSATITNPRFKNPTLTTDKNKNKTLNLKTKTVENTKTSGAASSDSFLSAVDDLLEESYAEAMKKNKEVSTLLSKNEVESEAVVDELLEESYAEAMKVQKEGTTLQNQELGAEMEIGGEVEVAGEQEGQVINKQEKEKQKDSKLGIVIEYEDNSFEENEMNEQTNTQQKTKQEIKELKTTEIKETKLDVTKEISTEKVKINESVHTDKAIGNKLEANTKQLKKDIEKLSLETTTKEQENMNIAKLGECVQSPINESPNTRKKKRFRNLVSPEPSEKTVQSISDFQGFEDTDLNLESIQHKNPNDKKDKPDEKDKQNLKDETIKKPSTITKVSTTASSTSGAFKSSTKTNKSWHDKTFDKPNDIKDKNVTDTRDSKEKSSREQSSGESSKDTIGIRESTKDAKDKSSRDASKDKNFKDDLKDKSSREPSKDLKDKRESSKDCSRENSKDRSKQSLKDVRTTQEKNSSIHKHIKAPTLSPSKHHHKDDRKSRESKDSSKSRESSKSRDVKDTKQTKSETKDFRDSDKKADLKSSVPNTSAKVMKITEESKDKKDLNKLKDKVDDLSKSKMPEITKKPQDSKEHKISSTTNPNKSFASPSRASKKLPEPKDKKDTQASRDSSKERKDVSKTKDPSNSQSSRELSKVNTGPKKSDTRESSKDRKDIKTTKDLAVANKTPAVQTTTGVKKDSKDPNTPSTSKSIEKSKEVIKASPQINKNEKQGTPKSKGALKDNSSTNKGMPTKQGTPNPAAKSNTSKDTATTTLKSPTKPFKDIKDIKNIEIKSDSTTMSVKDKVDSKPEVKDDKNKDQDKKDLLSKTIKSNEGNEVMNSETTAAKTVEVKETTSNKSQAKTTENLNTKTDKSESESKNTQNLNTNIKETPSKSKKLSIETKTVSIKLRRTDDFKPQQKPKSVDVKPVEKNVGHTEIKTEAIITTVPKISNQEKLKSNESPIKAPIEVIKSNVNTTGEKPESTAKPAIATKSVETENVSEKKVGNTKLEQRNVKFKRRPIKPVQPKTQLSGDSKLEEPKNQETLDKQNIGASEDKNKESIIESTPVKKKLQESSNSKQELPISHNVEDVVEDKDLQKDVLNSKAEHVKFGKGADNTDEKIKPMETIKTSESNPQESLAENVNEKEMVETKDEPVKTRGQNKSKTEENKTKETKSIEDTGKVIEHKTENLQIAKPLKTEENKTKESVKETLKVAEENKIQELKNVSDIDGDKLKSTMETRKTSESEEVTKTKDTQSVKETGNVADPEAEEHKSQQLTNVLDTDANKTKPTMKPRKTLHIKPQEKNTTMESVEQIVKVAEPKTEEKESHQLTNIAENIKPTMKTNKTSGLKSKEENKTKDTESVEETGNLAEHKTEEHKSEQLANVSDINVENIQPTMKIGISKLEEETKTNETENVEQTEKVADPKAEEHKSQQLKNVLDKPAENVKPTMKTRTTSNSKTEEESKTKETESADETDKVAVPKTEEKMSQQLTNVSDSQAEVIKTTTKTRTTSNSKSEEPKNTSAVEKSSEESQPKFIKTRSRDNTKTEQHKTKESTSVKNIENVSDLKLEESRSEELRNVSDIVPEKIDTTVKTKTTSESKSEDSSVADTKEEDVENKAEPIKTRSSINIKAEKHKSNEITGVQHKKVEECQTDTEESKPEPRITRKRVDVKANVTNLTETTEKSSELQKDGDIKFAEKKLVGKSKIGQKKDIMEKNKELLKENIEEEQKETTSDEVTEDVAGSKETAPALSKAASSKDELSNSKDELSKTEPSKSTEDEVSNLDTTTLSEKGIVTNQIETKSGITITTKEKTQELQLETETDIVIDNVEEYMEHLFKNVESPLPFAEPQGISTTENVTLATEISASNSETLNRRTLRKRGTDSPFPENDNNKKIFKDPIAMGTPKTTKIEKSSVDVQSPTSSISKRLRSPAMDADSQNVSKKPKLETPARKSTRFRNLHEDCLEEEELPVTTYAPTAMQDTLSEKPINVLEVSQSSRKSLRRETTQIKNTDEIQNPVKNVQSVETTESKKTATVNKEKIQEMNKSSISPNIIEFGETAQPPKKLPRREVIDFGAFEIDTTETANTLTQPLVNDNLNASKTNVTATKKGLPDKEVKAVKNIQKSAEKVTTPNRSKTQKASTSPNKSPGSSAVISFSDWLKTKNTSTEKYSIPITQASTKTDVVLKEEPKRRSRIKKNILSTCKNIEMSEENLESQEILKTTQKETILPIENTNIKNASEITTECKTDNKTIADISALPDASATEKEQSLTESMSGSNTTKEDQNSLLQPAEDQTEKLTPKHRGRPFGTLKSRPNIVKRLRGKGGRSSTVTRQPQLDTTIEASTTQVVTTPQTTANNENKTNTSLDKPKSTTPKQNVRKSETDLLIESMSKEMKDAGIQNLLTTDSHVKRRLASRKQLTSSQEQLNNTATNETVVSSSPPVEANNMLSTLLKESPKAMHFSGVLDMPTAAVPTPPVTRETITKSPTKRQRKQKNKATRRSSIAKETLKIDPVHVLNEVAEPTEKLSNTEVSIEENLELLKPDVPKTTRRNKNTKSRRSMPTTESIKSNISLTEILPLQNVSPNVTAAVVSPTTQVPIVTKSRKSMGNTGNTGNKTNRFVNKVNTDIFKTPKPVTHSTILNKIPPVDDITQLYATSNKRPQTKHKEKTKPEANLLKTFKCRNLRVRINRSVVRRYWLDLKQTNLLTPVKKTQPISLKKVGENEYNVNPPTIPSIQNKLETNLRIQSVVSTANILSRPSENNTGLLSETPVSLSQPLQSAINTTVTEKHVLPTTDNQPYILPESNVPSTHLIPVDTGIPLELKNEFMDENPISLEKTILPDTPTLLARAQTITQAAQQALSNSITPTDIRLLTSESSPNAYVPSFGVAPTQLNNRGTCMYTFLHPAKYNRTHSNVLLDYCCPNLDGPMPAIDPTRIHAQVQTKVIEIPACIVLTTKFVTRADLENNNKSIPAIIRKKAERIRSNIAAHHNVVSAQTAPTIPPSSSSGHANAHLIAQQQRAATQTPLSSSINALTKHLPATTTITPKVRPTPSIQAHNSPILTHPQKYQQHATTVSVMPKGQPQLSNLVKSALRSNLRRFDVLLKQLVQPFDSLTFVDRHRVIESLINSGKLLPKDLERTLVLMEEYLKQVSLIKTQTTTNDYSTHEVVVSSNLPSMQMPQLHPAPNLLASSSSSSSSSSAYATASKQLEQLHNKTVRRVQSTTNSNNSRITVPASSAGSDVAAGGVAAKQRHVPIYDTDRNIIGYQLQMVSPMSTMPAYTKSTMSSRTTGGIMSTSHSLENQITSFSISKRPVKRPAQESPRVFYTTPPLRTSTPKATLPQLAQKTQKGSYVTIRSGGNTSSGGSSETITTTTMATVKRVTRSTATGSKIIIVSKSNQSSEETILPDSGNQETEIKNENDVEDFIG